MKNASMKKWHDYFFRFFFVLCLVITIGVICIVVKCCSGNTVSMYDGVVDNSVIQIEKDLGNATMASYMTVYVDGQKVYNEKCSPRDTVEDVVLNKEMGILQIYIREKTDDTSYRDTITINIKRTEDQK